MPQWPVSPLPLPPEESQEPEHRGLWGRVTRLWESAKLPMAALGVAVSVLAAAVRVWGPLWPVEPVFSFGAPSFGPAFDVSFSATNSSSIFWLRNVRISCKMQCFRSVGPTGASFLPNGFGFTVDAVGPINIPADDTLPYICSLLGKIGIDNRSADSPAQLKSAQVDIVAEYDDPWHLWMRRKLAKPQLFSLNTRTIPPQWVAGDLPGSCDF